MLVDFFLTVGCTPTIKFVRNRRKMARKFVFLVLLNAIAVAAENLVLAQCGCAKLWILKGIAECPLIVFALNLFISPAIRIDVVDTKSAPICVIAAMNTALTAKQIENISPDLIPIGSL